MVIGHLLQAIFYLLPEQFSLLKLEYSTIFYRDFHFFKWRYLSKLKCDLTWRRLSWRSRAKRKAPKSTMLVPLLQRLSSYFNLRKSSSKLEFLNFGFFLSWVWSGCWRMTWNWVWRIFCRLNLFVYVLLRTLMRNCECSLVKFGSSLIYSSPL